MLYATSASWAAEEEPKTHEPGQINAALYLSYIMFGEPRRFLNVTREKNISETLHALVMRCKSTVFFTARLTLLSARLLPTYQW